MRHSVRAAASALLIMAVVAGAVWVLGGTRGAPAAGSVAQNVQASPAVTPAPAQVAVAATPTPAGHEAAPEGTPVPLNQEPPAVQQDEGCHRYVVILDSLPVTTELAARASTSVFVGTVEEVGSGRWRTDNGLPPDDERASGFNVMRLLRVNIDELLGGEPLGDPKEAVVWVNGGTIGCSEYEMDAIPTEFKAGQQFVFFVNDGAQPGESWTGVPHAIWVWQVKGSKVITPTEGSVELSEVRAAVGQR
jgi:hypothetical protein